MISQGIQTNAPETISLRDIVAPFFRKQKLLITTFIVTLGGALFIGLLIPAPYRSQMEIIVNRERLDPLVTTESTSQLPPNASTEVTEEEINSEADLITSQDVLENVVLATGLNRQGSPLSRILPRRSASQKLEEAVKTLAKHLKVASKPKTNLIGISYSSPDPRLSYEVLHALGNFYMEKHEAAHRPPGSFNFFAEETQKYSNALRASEQKLKEFSAKEGLAAPDVERTDLAQSIADAIGQLHMAEQSVASDEARIHTDREQVSVIPERSSTQRIVSPADKLIEDLNASLLEAERRKTQLNAKYDDSYPLVQEVDKEITQTKEAIAAAEKTNYISETTDRDPTHELIREDLAKTQTDLSGQRAGVAAYRRGIQSMQAQMVDLDQKATEQQDLLREVKANEENYLLYLSKREQERTSDALDKTRIANVGIVVPPAIPVLPVYSVLAVIAFGFGLAGCVSIIAAYAADYFDSRFHTPSQVTEVLGIPIVVAMPRRTA